MITTLTVSGETLDEAISLLDHKSFSFPGEIFETALTSLEAVATTVSTSDLREETLIRASRLAVDESAAAILFTAVTRKLEETRLLADGLAGSTEAALINF